MGKAVLPTIKITQEDARTLLLDAQGLLSDPSRSARPAKVRQLIEQLGFVQIDSINVIERAHHLTLFTRLDDYRPRRLTRLLEKDRSLFEHWTHDASAIPTRWFAQWRPRFEKNAVKAQANKWWQKSLGPEPDKVIEHVRQRIERDGPLMSKDFEHRGEGNGNGPWWDWKPQKAALEYLWYTGQLMIARRVNFHKVYDLTERTLPDVHEQPTPTEDEYIAWRCHSALDRLGVATPAEIAGFWGGIPLAQARSWCKQAEQAGEIVPVSIYANGNGKYRASYAVPDWQQRIDAAPAPPTRLRLLCPFDPVIRDRQRALRLFGFDYRFEAFVPAAKRQYGYYVLPLLEGDRFVGRLDAKFDRKQKVLRINGLWWEPKIKVTRMRKAALDEALHRLAGFVGAEGLVFATIASK